MLLRFAVENFKSFRDSTQFSMAAGKITRHGNHIAEICGKRILKGGFLFGANASGKSNLIQALEFACRIVKNGMKSVSFDKKYFRIDDEGKARPGVFQFDLVSNGHFYSYGFAVSYTEATIEEEWLYEIGNREKCVFLRQKDEDGTSFRVTTDIKFDGERFRVYAEDFHNLSMGRTVFLSDVAQRSPEDEENYQAFRDVWEWFQRVRFIFPSSQCIAIPKLLEDDDRRTKFSDLLRYFDTGIESVSKKDVDFDKLLHSSLTDQDAVALKQDMERTLEDGHWAFTNLPQGLIEVCKKDGALRASEVVASHGNNLDLFENADESDGTRRLFDLIPIYQAALEGGIIFVDEIDRSLHTQATQEFIRLFYQQTQGVGTQLIATTQESNIMDLDFLRQDEIWFVERQKDHSSRIYSLNQFKERYDKDIEKSYQLGRYGAVPVFRQFSMMENNEEEGYAESD